MRQIHELMNRVEGTRKIKPYLFNQIERFLAQNLVSPYNRHVNIAIGVREADRQKALISKGVWGRGYAEMIMGIPAMKDFKPHEEEVANWIVPQIAVQCDTAEDTARFLAAAGLKGNMKFPPGTCFSLSNGFAHSTANFYRKIGYEVVNWREFAETETDCAN